MKTNKDNEKWWEFHKSLIHNTNDCRMHVPTLSQNLTREMKGSPLTYFGEGFSTTVHYQNWEPKNLIQQRSLSSSACRPHNTHNHTPLGSSTKENIFISTNNVTFPITSSPSCTRYCVMLLLLNSVMFYQANHTYGSIILWMSPNLKLLLLFQEENYTRYQRQPHLPPFL